jgi:hypothetical protein
MSPCRTNQRFISCTIISPNRWQRLVRLCAGVDELVLVAGLSVGAPGYGPLPMLQPMDIATTQRTARLLRGKVDLG